MIYNVASRNNLAFVVESGVLGNMVIDQEYGHQSLVVATRTITLEVNPTGAKVLEFIFDFGKPTAPFQLLLTHVFHQKCMSRILVRPSSRYLQVRSRLP